ncbi:MAG: ribonuclease HII [Candidatus Omnitrophica bacterium]|nr:ribonuclease HII [Candidatus Omnitrophota bacterium]
MSKGVNIKMLAHEDQAKADGFDLVIGIDEAGRGPLAGPVVAAAVHINDLNFSCKIDDSKKLTHQQREDALNEIMMKCDFGVGIMTEAVIDEHNILQSTFMAMKAAVLDLADNMELPVHRVCLLVDGNRCKSDLPYAVRTIIGGDAQSFSIACASIIAKVTRDRLLNEYDKVFPQYGFAKHKGYPTKEHKDAIREHGLSPIHRRTFRHVA